MHFWLSIVGLNEPNNLIRVAKCEHRAATISAIKGNNNGVQKTDRLFLLSLRQKLQWRRRRHTHTHSQSARDILPLSTHFIIRKMVEPKKILQKRSHTNAHDNNANSIELLGLLTNRTYSNLKIDIARNSRGKKRDSNQRQTTVIV